MKHSSTATKKYQDKAVIYAKANQLPQYSTHAVNKTPGFSHENESLNSES